MNIHEVAKAAGVSVATVSRVINHPEIVAEKTRERVLAVLKETSYAPNLEPRSRHIKKKHAIAVILPATLEYRNVHAGIRQIGNAKNCGVQFCLIERDPQELLRNVRGLIAQQIDGVILAADTGVGNVLDQLREAGIPVVCIGGRRNPENDNMCYINFSESADKLGQYVIDSANESVMLLLSREESDCREGLRHGFCEAWTKAGKAMDRLAFLEIEESFKGGYLAASQIFDTGESIPDLILAQFDEMAIGAMKAAEERRINVPKQLHVIGFHDAPVSTAVQPELTSVEQPTLRLGIVAARRLFDIIEDQEFFDIESQEIALKGRLKIRRSCGNRKAIYEIYE